MLAIFDLDNTLLGGDSDYLWGEFLIAKKLVDPLWHKEQNDKFLADYQSGKLDISKWLEFQLTPLKSRPLEFWLSLRVEFIAGIIKPIVLPRGREELKKCADNGYTLMIISATNSFIARPIADLLGVENLLATEPEIVDQHFSGRVVGIITYRDGKVDALKSWLKNKRINLAGSRFYSDSFNDLPLMRFIDNPIAVDPDNTLRAFARDKGWKIVSFR